MERSFATAVPAVVIVREVDEPPVLVPVSDAADTEDTFVQVYSDAVT
jgi:hypothetical protein